MKSDEFASAIFELYPPFRQWDDVTLQAWTNIIIKECGVFSNEIRAKAFTTLTRVKHKEKPPQPATIFGHCLEAKRWRDSEDNKGKLPAMRADDDGWSTERKTLVSQLLRTELGRQAARDGWVRSLKDFCLRQGRVPAGREIEQCKKDALCLGEAVAMLARMKPGPALPAGVLKALRDAADVRVAVREKLAEEVLRNV